MWLQNPRSRFASTYSSTSTPKVADKTFHRMVHFLCMLNLASILVSADKNSFTNLSPPCLGRSTQSQGEKAEAAGGEASSYSLHVRAARATEGRVPGEPLPHREAEAGPGARAWTQRVPDQNLVPEQAGQDQEVDGSEESVGVISHVGGTVQPRHYSCGGGGLTSQVSHTSYPGHCSQKCYQGEGTRGLLRSSSEVL